MDCVVCPVVAQSKRSCLASFSGTETEMTLRASSFFEDFPSFGPAVGVGASGLFGSVDFSTGLLASGVGVSEVLVCL